MVAVNGYDEDRGTVQSYVTQQKLKQPILLMGRAVSRDKYSVSGFPTKFWIDHDGKVVHKDVGFSPDAYPSMEARLERLLAAAKRGALEAIVK